jgi:putative hemolysin
METSAYVIIGLTLIFSFFFSGIEIAFLSANKLQIELQSKQGFRWGKIMSWFIKRQSWFIGTTLIGNTLALVLFGIYMAELIEPWLAANLPASVNDEAVILTLQTLISTLLILFTAEFLPKSLFLINPNLMLSMLAIPFAIAAFILAPLTFSIVYLSKMVIIHVLRIEYSEEKPVFALTDLNNYLKSMMKVRHDDEDIELDKKIFHNALEFKTVRIRDCMIPRTEVTALEVEEGMEKLKEAFVQSGHSKILIFKDSIDNVIGYCHSSALFKKPQKIEDILTPIHIAQETMMANQLMVQLLKDRKSMALVVDEFGGTSGIVSMEDVIEEIFGEIEDEHDSDTLIEQKIDAHTYLLSARLEVDYLNDTYKWQLPTGDYGTLGGLILSYTEDFPSAGETISIPPYSFTIQKTENKLINTVKITVDDESGGKS